MFFATVTCRISLLQITRKSRTRHYIVKRCFAFAFVLNREKFLFLLRLFLLLLFPLFVAKLPKSRGGEIKLFKRPESLPEARTERSLESRGSEPYDGGRAPPGPYFMSIGINRFLISVISPLIKLKIEPEVK